MPHQFKTVCSVCAAPSMQIDEEKVAVCSICNKPFKATSTCENNHFVCASCKQNALVDTMLQHCLSSLSTSPIALAQELMQLPNVNIHGPIHHFIVPAVLLTAYSNTTGKLDLQPALEEAAKRSKNIPGGACAAWGVCGAAVGTGIFISIATQVSPLSTIEWKTAGKMTAQSAHTIAELGGPRCCKRDSFLALQEAVLYANAHLQTNFPLPSITCEFFHANKQCKGKACPFFPEKE